MSAFSRQLVHSCTLERSIPIQNGIGEPVDVWGELAAGVACRLVVKQEKFADERLGLQMKTTHLLLLPAGTEVTTADRVKDIAIEDGESLAGPFGIEEVIPRRGPKNRVNHINLRLELIE